MQCLSNASGYFHFRLKIQMSHRVKRNLKTNYNLEKVCDVKSGLPSVGNRRNQSSGAFDELDRLKVEELPYNKKRS